MDNQDPFLTEKFLSLPATASPEIRRIASELTRKNEVSGFIARMAKQDGFAIWDKLIVNTTIGHSNVVVNGANSTNNSVTDTIIYIPLVMETTNNVNGFIYAKLNGSISLQLHRANDYASYGFGDIADSTDNAERHALQIMVLDNNVFGYTKFKLEDDRLFKDAATQTSSTDSVVRFLEIRNIDGNETANAGTSNAGTTNAGTASGHWEQGTITHCTQTTTYPVIAVAITPGMSSTTWSCTTTVQYYFVSNDDDDPGQNGNPGSGGGGSSGGGGPTDSIQCNPTPELDNGFLPCPRGNTTGWMPVLEDFYDPHLADNVILDTSISNNYPCVQNLIDTLAMYGQNLNQDAQIALSQIFGINKRIHTTIKLQPNLVGTGTGAYTRKTGGMEDPNDTSQLNFSATIYINPDLLNNGTKEYITTTLVHEAMHAYINYIFTLYNQHYIADSNYVKNKFPIFWGNLTLGSPPSEIQHHNLMALNWVQQVSDPLYAFTNNSIDPAMKDSIYHALGWGGLEETDIFKLKADKCDIMAINSAASNKNQGSPFTLNNHPECAANYNITAQSLKLKNLCD